MVKIIQDSHLAHNKTQKSKIHKWSNNTNIVMTDEIAIESPLEIRLGDDRNHFQTLAITMCTPADIDDLIYGYLFTENIITKNEDILGIKIFDNDLGLIVETLLCKNIGFEKFLHKRHGKVHASCGVCGKTEFEDLLTFDYPKLKLSHLKLNSDVVATLPQKLNQNQQAFTQTGGIHASALFEMNGKLVCVREDIGRHNALDKLIGYALKHDLLPLTDYIILLSGRVSFELVHKSLIVGLTHLCAIGAPSSLSIEMAKVNNLCLFGFIKAGGYNEY